MFATTFMLEVIAFGPPWLSASVMLAIGWLLFGGALSLLASLRAMLDDLSPHHLLKVGNRLHQADADDAEQGGVVAHLRSRRTSAPTTPPPRSSAPTPTPPPPARAAAGTPTKRSGRST